MKAIEIVLADIPILLIPHIRAGIGFAHVLFLALNSFTDAIPIKREIIAGERDINERTAGAPV